MPVVVAPPAHSHPLSDHPLTVDGHPQELVIGFPVDADLHTAEADPASAVLDELMPVANIGADRIVAAFTTSAWRQLQLGGSSPQEIPLLRQDVIQRAGIEETAKKYAAILHYKKAVGEIATGAAATCASAGLGVGSYAGIRHSFADDGSVSETQSVGETGASFLGGILSGGGGLMLSFGALRCLLNGGRSIAVGRAASASAANAARIRAALERTNP